MNNKVTLICCNNIVSIDNFKQQIQSNNDYTFSYIEKIYDFIDDETKKNSFTLQIDESKKNNYVSKGYNLLKALGVDISNNLDIYDKVNNIYNGKSNNDDGLENIYNEIKNLIQPKNVDNYELLFITKPNNEQKYIFLKNDNSYELFQHNNVYERDEHNNAITFCKYLPKKKENNDFYIYVLNENNNNIVYIMCSNLIKNTKNNEYKDIVIATNDVCDPEMRFAKLLRFIQNINYNNNECIIVFCPYYKIKEATNLYFGFIMNKTNSNIVNYIVCDYHKKKIYFLSNNCNIDDPICEFKNDKEILVVKYNNNNGQNNFTLNKTYTI